MIRILIVDDQNLVQQGIKSLLERDLEFQVIGTVQDGRDAVRQIGQIHPDVVLLDIEMPGMNGITTTKYINRISPKTKVIILSSHEDKKYVMQALMAGAKGYILKTSLMTDLKQAIVAVNNGYSQIDSRLLAKVFDPKSIKAKKSDLNSEEDLQERNNSKLERDKDRLKTTFRDRETVGLIQSQISKQNEVSESVVVESKTIPRSQKNESNPLSKEEISNSVLPETEKFSAEIDDSVSPKEVEKEIYSDKPNKYDLQSSSIVNETTLAPIVKKKSVEQYKFPIITSKSKKKTFIKNKHLAKLLNRLKIKRLKSEFVRQKNKLQSLVKQKQQQNILWNLGLLIFGILIVMLLGKL